MFFAHMFLVSFRTLLKLSSLSQNHKVTQCNKIFTTDCTDTANHSHVVMLKTY